MSKKTIICLMGPTGVGKTQVAIKLVQNLPLEIISVDSAMVYRGLDIGSAKPTEEELKLAPHRLIDICDPGQAYSVAKFRKDALREIADIIDNGKIPLLVGGTMLYFKGLLHGLSKLPADNKEIRDSLQKELEVHGFDYLHNKLKKVDPQSAARISIADFKRVQRALEVHMITGKTITQLWHENRADAIPHKTITIGLMPGSRALLAEKLAARFKNMLEQGLIQEVEKLYKRGNLTDQLPAIRSVGYRQVWQYLSGELSYDEMVERAIIATRQLAKRQLTWLKSWPDVQLFEAEDLKIYEKVYSYIEKKIK